MILLEGIPCIERENTTRDWKKNLKGRKHQENHVLKYWMEDGGDLGARLISLSTLYSKADDNNPNK